jgi:Cdc6-like AAA superfamily ATPase
LIQGPPGTGKTYVGEKVVKALLKIKQSWRHHGPILMVCYTNHALDQFLKLISKETSKFIRIGGRCSKDLMLQNHVMREFLKINGIKYSSGYNNTYGDLKDLIGKFEIEHSNQLIESFGIINDLVDDFFMKEALVIIDHQFGIELKTVMNSNLKNE